MIRQITVNDLHTRLTAGENVLLLDVRQPEEYAICRLENATLIPLGELPRRADELDVPKDTAVVVYCHHGIRSITGAHMLLLAGYTDVASLAGGIEAWSLQIDPAIPRY